MNATIGTDKDAMETKLALSNLISENCSPVPLTCVPPHVAIVMDGNRRWARARGLPAIAGHAAGAKCLEPILDTAIALGIRTVTFFVFSTENWSRSREEIDAIFSIMGRYLDEQLQKAEKKGIRLRFIGDGSALPQTLYSKMCQAQSLTQHCDRLTAVFAVNYGGRNEMLRAMRHLARLVQTGELEADQIREWHLSEALDTKNEGDPQLFIRTSGEQRLSNFLLWQLAYSELYFTPVNWPDFTPEHFIEALKFYQTRHRRFGV